VSRGVAGWYGEGFEGATTANGERLNSSLRTIAHRTLPFGTVVRVVNTANGRGVVARVNDRGPIQTDRLIDVTTRISQELAFNDAGRANVQVEVLEAETRRVADLTGGVIGNQFASGGSGLSGVGTVSSQPLIPSSSAVTPSPSTQSTPNGVGQLPAPVPSNTSPSTIEIVNSGVNPSSVVGQGNVYIQA